VRKSGETNGGGGEFIPNAITCWFQVQRAGSYRVRPRAKEVIQPDNKILSQPSSHQYQDIPTFQRVSILRIRFCFMNWKDLLSVWDYEQQYDDCYNVVWFM